MGRFKKISYEEYIKIQQMIEEGYKVQYIAMKLERATSSVYRSLNGNAKRPAKRWSVEEKKTVKELKAKGLSYTEIGKLLGRNRVCINNLLRYERKKATELVDSKNWG
jgi:IS30 family transposase